VTDDPKGKKGPSGGPSWVPGLDATRDRYRDQTPDVADEEEGDKMR